jgi:serine/threonine-protein kinase
VEQTLNDDKIVLDKTTGLMWQQSGSSNYMVYSETKKYIRKLNNKSFANFTDWRLPTLKEAMSLMEAQKTKGDLYINSKFCQKQQWIWTADRKSAGRAWVVYFSYGVCDHRVVDYASSVRAVRS